MDKGAEDEIERWMDVGLDGWLGSEIGYTRIDIVTNEGSKGREGWMD